MKLILATLLLVVAAKAWEDQEKYMIKKWTMLKALESCVGEDNVKMYMVKKKQAMAKCSKQEYPLLELPIFQSNYKTASALVQSAYSDKSHGMGMDHHHHAHGHDDDKKYDGALLRYFVEKVVRDAMDDDDDDDYDDFRKQFRRRRPLLARFARDADQQALEIGDRLNMKLDQLQQEMSDHINNCTCVLKECKILDRNGKFNDVETIIDEMNPQKLGDAWLAKHIERDVRICHEMADNAPEQLLNECVLGPEMAKVKCYKKCLKMRKLKTCMNHDIKQQLEENFAPLDKLVQQTEIEEKNLLPLVYKLLHGDESKMRF